MNTSLGARLNKWLSLSILVAGLTAAAISFVMSFNDANDLQDRQLRQVAELLADGGQLPPSPEFKPHTDEDAEAHFVVKRLGAPVNIRNPTVDVALPLTLKPGLQFVANRGVNWRVMVTENAEGQRFGVAQRMTIRDEAARDTALYTLLPLVILLPALVLVVGFVVQRTFAPLIAMSAGVDRLSDKALDPLDESSAPSEVLTLVQAVNRLMLRLSIVLALQRRLVSDAAHELRTPLATLAVQADNVMHVELPQEARRRLMPLRQGLARMSALIEQLLNFARVQGGTRTSAVRLELNSIVRTAIEEILPLAQGKGVDLGCTRIDAASIAGDRQHAYALIRNVIDNAVRYTPGGGTVDVSVALEQGLAIFVVEDTGPGIADKDIERVFEPFVRILGSGEEGSGLGLAIVLTAAHELGGQITAGRRIDGRPGLRFAYRQAAA